jgi:protein phosphatase
LWSEICEDSKKRAALDSPVLPPISLVEVAGGAVIVAEAWPQARELPEGPQRGYSGDWSPVLRKLLRAFRPLADALTALDQAGLVWLNFDPTALESQGERWRVSNLDWQAYPKGSIPSKLRISPRYSPPEVCDFDARKTGPATDVFHLAIAMYYWLAGLPGGLRGSGLQFFRHQLPMLRLFQPLLPPGIAGALERGLAAEPSRRPASSAAYFAEIEAAIEAAESRYHPLVAELAPRRSLWQPLGRLFARKKRLATRLDLGGACATGRAKEALGTVNQDTIAFGRLPGDAAWLIAADGVTNCRAGSGDIASRLASEKLQTALEALSKNTDDRSFDLAASEGLAGASQEIVRQARAVHKDLSSLNDSDVMSSTAVAALASQNRLHVASVGDSRAYLVTGEFIDQLTLDGDVASELLSADTPPEQVLEMGLHAKALRTCAGAAKIAEGEMVADLERCRPQLTHWPLLAGDVVLLCSDGLIDEGVFLDPADAWSLVKQHLQEPAQLIAERLVAAADSLQRLPSTTEPQGFGDNIACVVLKVLPFPSRE